MLDIVCCIIRDNHLISYDGNYSIELNDDVKRLKGLPELTEGMHVLVVIKLLENTIIVIGDLRLGDIHDIN